MPLVSIVIPAYNAARTISYAIESVLMQTCQDFEIVICDDASTDETVAVVQAVTDSRINLIANQKNLGEGPSRDRAIETARGQWITALDADDAYGPQRLEKLLAVAKQNPTAVVFDEIMECHDTPSGLVPWRPVRAAGAFPRTAHATAIAVSIVDWIYAPRMLMQPLVPSELIRNFGVRHPPLRFGADLVFKLSLLARSHAPLWYVPDSLYFYRLGARSMSAVSDRYSLLADVLESTTPLFNWDPSIQDAISRKVVTVRKIAVYQEFFSALMHGHISDAVSQARHQPWVLVEFIRRSSQRIPYHVSRWRHSGTRRETT